MHGLLTALASDLTDVHPFTLPVDIVCHVETYLAAVVGLPFIANLNIAIMIGDRAVDSQAKVEEAE